MTRLFLFIAMACAGSSVAADVFFELSHEHDSNTETVRYDGAVWTTESAREQIVVRGLALLTARREKAALAEFGDYPRAMFWFVPMYETVAHTDARHEGQLIPTHVSMKASGQLLKFSNAKWSDKATKLDGLHLVVRSQGALLGDFPNLPADFIELETVHKKLYPRFSSELREKLRTLAAGKPIVIEANFLMGERELRINLRGDILASFMRSESVCGKVIEPTH